MSNFILSRIEDGPQQERTRSRLLRALLAAEELLIEIGPELISIPEIEKRSNVPRTAIYRYFPDKYVLLSTMAAGYMDLLGSVIVEASAGKTMPSWQDALAIAIRRASEFYNAHPVAGILLFNGPFTANDREAHSGKAERLVGALQGVMPKNISEDSLPLTIEIAFACFRYGYYRDGHLSDIITAEAINAATSYLEAVSEQQADL